MTTQKTESLDQSQSANEETAALGHVQADPSANEETAAHGHEQADPAPAQPASSPVMKAGLESEASEINKNGDPENEYSEKEGLEQWEEPTDKGSSLTEGPQREEPTDKESKGGGLVNEKSEGEGPTNKGSEREGLTNEGSEREELQTEESTVIEPREETAKRDQRSGPEEDCKGGTIGKDTTSDPKSPGHHMAFASVLSLASMPIRVAEEALEQAAEALCQSRLLPPEGTQESVHKIVLAKNQ